MAHGISIEPLKNFIQIGGVGAIFNLYSLITYNKSLNSVPATNLYFQSKRNKFTKHAKSDKKNSIQIIVF